MKYPSNANKLKTFVLELQKYKRGVNKWSEKTFVLDILYLLGITLDDMYLGAEGFKLFEEKVKGFMG